MRFSRFFIDRPIFAGVVSVFITLMGIFAFPALPLAQYPDIAPPSVMVMASYPGASAETVAETVAACADIVSNRARASSIALEAAEFVRRHHSWAGVAQAFSDACDQAVQRFNKTRGI